MNASAVGAEVHLGEALGRDLLELLELLLGGAPFLRGEEAVSELRGQNLGDVAVRESSVVPGAAMNPNRARVETIKPSRRDAEPGRAEDGFACWGAECDGCGGLAFRSLPTASSDSPAFRAAHSDSASGYAVPSAYSPR